MSKEIEIELLSPMREGGGGTSDYEKLENKPQINGVELVGNKTTKELGIKIPTKTSDLTNDSKFVNEQFVNDAVKKETDRAVEAENGISSSLNAHITNTNNPHNVTKTQVGLGNVDNTSDKNKPISDATQTALTHLQETIDEQISTINAAIENKQDKITETNKLSYNLLKDTPTIPTKTSELENDSGYVTETQLNTKQDKLTATQLEATNSGANSTNIAQISTNKTNIDNINGKIPSTASSTNKLVDNTSMTNALANKQNTLSQAQLNAVNSGITSAKVTQYDGYATSKQDKLTDADLGYGLGFVNGKLSVTIPVGTDKEY